MANPVAQVEDEDDVIQGQPIFLIRPDENVYSYFMFIGPTEAKRKERKPPALQNETNWDIVMGYILIALNFFMQTILLYLIFEEVVISNFHWQQGILKLGGGANSMGLVSTEVAGCNDGGSLCFQDGDGYSCAPPSVQLTGRWDELDTDGDGIWTREEVTTARDALKCKYFVDPVEVFDVLVNLLKERESVIWLHPDVLKAKAIHMPYFTYIMSDVIMCGYRSVDMCSNLIERGFFDAPLKHGTSPRVGTTIDSALHYCTSLLKPGGACERNLPSTYAVWKVTGEGECGTPEYGTFEYTNPGNGQTKSLLSVDYAARVEYELAQATWFMTFKAIIIFLWLLLMTVEFKDVFKVLTLCARLPDAGIFGEDAVIMEQDPSDPEDVRYRVQAITRTHRMMLVTLSILRVLVTCVLAVVGVAYLIKTNGYADLIMNGIALVFIAEISSVLFDLVLREEVKDQTNDIKAIPVRMYGWDWLNNRPALIDMLWIICILIVACGIMYWQLTSVVVPVHDALECTCLSKGDHCKEARMYSYEFWQEYWMNGIPGVFKAVDNLKASQKAGAASYLAFTSGLDFFPTRDEQEQIMDLTHRIDDLEGHRLRHRSALLARSNHSALPGQTRSQHKKNRKEAKGHEPVVLGA